MLLMMAALSSFALVFILQMGATLQTQIRLDGDEWKVYNQSDRNHEISARVPGSIYTDLRRAGVLTQDPYYRFNDVEYRWVAKENWTYWRTIEVSEEIARGPIRLVCTGLDTVATVSINGRRIGSTFNMFRLYTWDISDAVKAGQNKIVIAFESPLTYAARQKSKYPYEVPPDCAPKVQHGECYRNHIRKEACSFSWDWGPAFPTMGIWQSLWLEVDEPVVIRYINVTTSKGRGDIDWVVQGSVCVEIWKDKIKGSLQVDIPGLISGNSVVVMVTKQSLCPPIKLLIPKSSKAKAWWPNGLGEQNLYDLQVTFTPKSHGVKVTKKVRIGFRTVELVQERVGKGFEGLSFYFRVNGVPVFMKGSNWIPANAFKENITDGYLRQLLQSAKEANINMLRVWGGGIYESDLFYDIADELGIFIWQDMMFACAMFPTDGPFLENVKQEVKHQIRRLQHHPSIAIWAGNNENEAALRDNWYGTKPNFTLYQKDYVKLYIDTIMTVVNRDDPGRSYVSSSPTNGDLTQQQGWIAKDPYSALYGDVHYYNYTSDLWDWHNTPVPRFMSEYGRQAWCSFESLKKVSVKDDWNINSQFVDHRQHHADGNNDIKRQIEKHMPWPQTADAVEDFKNFIYLSQVNQAMGIKAETEALLRGQRQLTKTGGMTMGALYWQLNDIWQAPTWASIEYGGKWKMLHYYARRFFNNTLISPYLEDGTLVVYLLTTKTAHDTMTTATNSNSLKFVTKKSLKAEKKDNDVIKQENLSDKIKNASVGPILDIYCYSWDSRPGQPKKVWYESFSESGNYTGDVNALLKEAGCKQKERCFFYFSLDGDLSGPTNFLLLSYFKTDVGLRKAKIQVTSVNKISETVYRFVLKTDRIAPFVWLEAEGIAGRFSDNGFLMVTPEVALEFVAWEPGRSLDDFKKALSVMSLMDVYQ